MFQPDSLLIRFLTKTCDLLFLNIVFVFSCSVISVYAPTKRICGMAVVDTINEL